MLCLAEHSLPGDDNHRRSRAWGLATIKRIEDESPGFTGAKHLDIVLGRIAPPFDDFDAPSMCAASQVGVIDLVVLLLTPGNGDYLSFFPLVDQHIEVLVEF